MSASIPSPKPRLLFCSYHSYLDPSSGAALSTRDLLELMVAHGWECAVLSGPELDLAQGESIEGLLRACRVPFQIRPGKVLDTDCTLYHGALNGVAFHSFVPNEHQPRQEPTKEQGRAFLSLFDHVHKRFRPDIVLTYGGQWVAFHVIHRARAHGAKVVFFLRNFAYDRRDLFREVDAVLVPSQATSAHYENTLQLNCTAIPGPFNWERVTCPEVRGRYVTLVNPQPNKGCFWFARIACELNRLRPDVRFLVVESRGQVDWLLRCDLDMTGVGNIDRMPHTLDPRQFYRASRMVLVPSLWQEPFARVVVEAMLNGIPVLASRRGGLPEALTEAGFLFDIPEAYTPLTRHAPTAEEVAPWLETIVKLWDDDSFHAIESQRSRQAAEAWRPERLWPRFETFFQNVLMPSDKPK